MNIAEEVKSSHWQFKKEVLEHRNRLEERILEEEKNLTAMIPVVKEELEEKISILEEGNKKYKEITEYNPGIDKESLFLFSSDMAEKDRYNLQKKTLENAAACIKERTTGCECFSNIESQYEEVKDNLFDVVVIGQTFKKNIPYLREELSKIILREKMTEEEIENQPERAEEIFLELKETVGKKVLDNIVLSTLDAKPQTKSYILMCEDVLFDTALKCVKILETNGVKCGIIHHKINKIVTEDKEINIIREKSLKNLKENKDKVAKKVKKKRKALILIAVLIAVVSYALMSFLAGQSDMLASSDIGVAIHILFAISGICFISGLANSKRKIERQCEAIDAIWISECLALTLCVQEELIIKLTSFYYEKCRAGFLFELDKMLQEIKLRYNACLRERENCFENYRQNSKKFLPDGLLDNPILLVNIIKVMEDGLASDYKQARIVAEDRIGRERTINIQRQYFNEKSKQDEIWREENEESQRRIEEYTREQAEYAERMALSQENAERYAKQAAESMGKIEQIERDREIREKEEYWRNR